ncbi:hypothetical protein PENSPDRAFT_689160 [Peniophora sp. CONT]|nr:hypothetical protein PENSPDRAFT_689160 [Peniophora sp. CONT]
MDHAPSAPLDNPASKSLRKLKFSKKSAVSAGTVETSAPAGATTSFGQSSPTTSTFPPESSVASSSSLPPKPSHLPAKPLKPLPLDFAPVLAVHWADNTALVALNTDYAPGDPRNRNQNEPYTCEDGLWGWREISRLPQPLNASAPYLAYMQVPPSDPDSAIARKLEFREPCREDADVSLTVNGRSQSNIFRTRGSVHDLLEKRMRALTDNLAFALATFEEACRAGINKSSITYRVACEIKPPHAAVSVMRRSWATLHWTDIPSFADFMACFRVYQRAAHTVSAYIDFIGAFLPPDFSKKLRRRLERSVKMDRRGVILAGDDVETYLRFFARLGVPVYALVSLDEYAVPENIFRKPDAPRCSVVPSAKLTDIRQRYLPASWYAPQGVDWVYFELVACGTMPRAENLHVTIEPKELKLSDQRESKKRKAAKELEGKKKQKLEKDKVEESFQKRHPDIGISSDRYGAFVIHAPAARRYFDTKTASRPPWVPAPRRAFLAVEAKALEHLSLLNIFVKPRDGELDEKKPDPKKGNGMLATFVPPIDVIYRTESDTRLYESLVYLVKLLPLLNLRPKEAPSNPVYRRLGPKDWKDMLSTAGWRRHTQESQLKIAKAKGRQKGERVPLVEFDPKNPWKWGHVLLLGESATAKLQASALNGDEMTLPRRWIGTLPCGCEPTFELLDGDEELASCILFIVNMQLLVYWLANLIDPARLESHGIKSARDLAGVHHTPDLIGLENVGSAYLAVVLQIVWNETTTMSSNGWGPTIGWFMAPWAPSDRCWDLPRQQWLDNMMKLLLWTNDADRDTLDRLFKNDRDWIPSAELEARNGRANPFSDDNQALDTLEEHVLLRYWLASFQRGQFPVPFLQTRQGMPKELPKCRHCRGATITPHKVAAAAPAPISAQTSAPPQQAVPFSTRAPSPSPPLQIPVQTAAAPVLLQTSAPHMGGWISAPSSTQKVIPTHEGMTEAFNDYGLSDEEEEEDSDLDDEGCYS